MTAMMRMSITGPTPAVPQGDTKYVRISIQCNRCIDFTRGACLARNEKEKQVDMCTSCCEGAFPCNNNMQFALRQLMLLLYHYTCILCNAMF